jgi:hypothetical protein
MMQEIEKLKKEYEEKQRKKKEKKKDDKDKDDSKDSKDKSEKDASSKADADDKDEKERDDKVRILLFVSRSRLRELSDSWQIEAIKKAQSTNTSTSDDSPRIFALHKYEPLSGLWCAIY